MSLLDQAERPFLSANEMANGDAATFVAKLALAAYADEFRKVFGADVFDDVDGAFFRARFAIEAYEQTEPALHPFDSKYDYFLAGKVDAVAGGIPRPRAVQPARQGQLPGVPSERARQRRLAAAVHRLHVRQPRPAAQRRDSREHRSRAISISACAVRSAPISTSAARSLRRVQGADAAQRRDAPVFFHNGVFKNLRDALRFYVRRDTNPDEFYPRRCERRRAEVRRPAAGDASQRQHQEVPYERHPGQAPRLNDAEIDDVVAFLGTLTDGYDPATDTADPARPLAPEN